MNIQPVKYHRIQHAIPVLEMAATAKPSHNRAIFAIAQRTRTVSNHPISHKNTDATIITRNALRPSAATKFSGAVPRLISYMRNYVAGATPKIAKHARAMIAINHHSNKIRATNVTQLPIPIVRRISTRPWPCSVLYPFNLAAIIALMRQVKIIFKKYLKIDLQKIIE